MTKIAQAAFKGVDGRVVGTGTFHNTGDLPEDFEISDEGFITEDGKFLTRNQASEDLHIDHPVQSQELDLIKKESEYKILPPETDGTVFSMKAIHTPTGKIVGEVTYGAKPNRLTHQGYHQIKTAEVSASHRGKGVYSDLLRAASGHARSLGNKGLVSEGPWRSESATNAWNKLANNNPAVKKLPGKDSNSPDFQLSEPDLTKMMTTPVFPHLGMPDNRRETPILNDKQQINTKQKLMANAQTNRLGRADAYPKLAQEATKSKPVGQASMVPNRNLSFALGNERRANTSRGQHQNSPVATQTHEDLHLMFNRVGSKFGNKARMNLAHNLYQAIPKDQSDALHHYVSSRYGSKKIDPKVFHEEHLAGMLNYLNNPAERDAYHNENMHDPQHRMEFGTKLKQAYRTVRNAARQADHTWTQRVMKKSESDLLQKSLQWKPGSEDLELANDMLHIYDNNMPEFQAARFLAPNVTPTEEQIQGALIEHEGDHDAAALMAYGLPVTEENVVILKDIVRQMSLHKNEDLYKGLNFPQANKPPTIKPLVQTPSFKPPTVAPVGLSPTPQTPAMPKMEGLHSDVNSFMSHFKSLPKEGPSRGKMLTSHLNYGPFLDALHSHPQGAQIHSMLNNYLNSPKNAGFKVGSAQATVKSELELSKSEEEPSLFVIPRHIKPFNADSIPFVTMVQEAQIAGRIAAVKMNGKHSAGSCLLKDDNDHIWFLKPGSGGLSRAMGLNEESASQSRREVAFNNIGRVMGLGAYLPQAALILVDNQEVAMLQFFGAPFKSLDKYKNDNGTDLPSIFTKFVANGLIYKWAIMDYLLGQTDRHRGNALLDPGHNIRFIDAGSTFAGGSYNPAHDPRSFVPYYLRVFSLPRRWNILTPEEKYKTLPKLTPLAAESLKHWVDTLSEGQILAIMREFQLNPQPFIDRLKKLKDYPGTKSEFIAKFYCGLL